jgi:hypothetical protein
LRPFWFSYWAPHWPYTEGDIYDANALGWTGGFGGEGGPDGPEEGGYNSNFNFIVDYFIFPNEIGYGPEGAYLNFNEGDMIFQPAYGTWRLAPDAGSSFGLLASAMVALGAGRLFLCGRKN